MIIAPGAADGAVAVVAASEAASGASGEPVPGPS
jgi:hypothetical protein